jgi:hypothetical protein
LTARFTDPHLGVYCCGHVFRRERPVLLVAREDEEWQFLCGGPDHPDPSEPYHVGVGPLVGHDPTLHGIADLPSDWEAERGSVDAAWLRAACRVGN